MLFIGLGLYLLFWCLIRPFNFCRARARDFFSFIFRICSARNWWALDLDLHMAAPGYLFRLSIHTVTHNCHVSILLISYLQAPNP
jgi:hypothetical protein